MLFRENSTRFYSNKFDAIIDNDLVLTHLRDIKEIVGCAAGLFAMHWSETNLK